MISISDTHSSAHSNAAKLGPNHGYRIEGDIALLHAEVEVDADASARRAQWALQLWACESPFSGGTLRGVKVAEAALPLAEAAPEPRRLDAEALARLPGGQRDYSMVLVLASGAPGAFDQIHDFANYPARERFITPHLEGSVGYQVEAGDVVLRAEQIRNPRHADNLSGSLTIELWAVSEPYRGGAVDGGTLLATADVGRIGGDSTIFSYERRASFNTPVAGHWYVVMMLREWVPGGYVTRDYCTFGQPYVVTAPRVEAREEARSPAANDGANGTTWTLPAAKAVEPASVETATAETATAETMTAETATAETATAETATVETAATDTSADTSAVDSKVEAAVASSESTVEPTTAVIARPVTVVSEPAAAAQPAAAAHLAAAAQPAAPSQLAAAASQLAAAVSQPAAAKLATSHGAAVSPANNSSSVHVGATAHGAANGNGVSSAAPSISAHYATKSGAAANAAVNIAAPAAASVTAPAATPVAALTAVPSSAAPVAAKADDGRVSITHGTLEQLALVKGLSRKIAVEIVKGRPYASVDELTRVRGIGPKLLVKVRGLLSL